MILFVVLYIIITLIVGLLAARLVKNTEDYLLAGRKLPVYITSATLFATWFGSETILGSSSEFAQGGLIAVIKDPFGAALCLFVVGLFFARPLYRMKLLTLGDFYRIRYGRFTEFLSGIFIILTYIGWIAAQMVACGIILNIVTGVDFYTGMLAGSILVIIYTFFGGMWSVSVTDFLQMIVIIICLILVVIEVTGLINFNEIITATPDGFFSFFPEPDATSSLNYIAAWITIGLGSVAGQDIFQRVMSSKSEKVAVQSSFIAAFLYLTVALIPLLLALYGMQLLPHLLADDLDAQLLLPALINNYTSPFVQIMLFGALFSAIMSTASSALLAPAAILSENIIKPNFNLKSDKNFLWASRISVLFISVIALYMAFTRGNIYELVGESASVGLVSLFVPLAAGVFWKNATKAGAITSMFSGLFFWIITMWLQTDVEPVIYGLAASILGMIAGSLFINNKN